MNTNIITKLISNIDYTQFSKKMLECNDMIDTKYLNMDFVLKNISNNISSQICHYFSKYSELKTIEIIMNSCIYVSLKGSLYGSETLMKSIFIIKDYQQLIKIKQFNKVNIFIDEVIKYIIYTIKYNIVKAFVSKYNICEDIIKLIVKYINVDKYVVRNVSTYKKLNMTLDDIITYSYDIDNKKFPINEFYGDSLPYPKVTIEELDNELDDYFNNDNFKNKF